MALFQQDGDGLAVEPTPPAAPVTRIVSWDMTFSLLTNERNE
jgi:hypothetical protein